MLTVRIDGAAELKRLSEKIRTEGSKGLARQMGEALSRAAEPVRVSIAQEANEVMPSRGGYKTLLAASLRHRISRRLAGRTASLILATYADGTKERRDIRALERGNLRHPVFGRSHKLKRGKRKGTIRVNPWTVTKIRAGFHERGTANAMEAATAELSDVLDEFARRLAS